MKVIAIITAAGVGKRMHSSTPKQFLKINGKEILVYTLESFQNANSIEEIIITASKEYLNKIKLLVKKYDLRKVKKIVEGGAIRQISVYNALSSIEAKNDDLICVHDAVRPFITIKQIDEIISFAKIKKSVIAAEKAK
ncbi:MAG: 2-C-methyl-D-erythritol 4-phosphate cytidylyltransferase, partial [Ignavibacteria bacterium]|nr:2-C-methyl-D-erythritol 4-phosphate cytidylyltransferase [Ignavibacteria bacterium]